jgi:hypothetical protein
MDREIAAEMETIVTRMRGALARAMTVDSCGCPRTPREHAIEAAEMLLGKVPWAMVSPLAVVMLADLHEVAPVEGFDLN